MYIILNKKDPKNIFLWAHTLFPSKESAREAIVRALRAGQALPTLPNFSIHKINNAGTIFTHSEDFIQGNYLLDREE